jgi:DNA-binding CsgD family transcriptional regulator
MTGRTINVDLSERESEALREMALNKEMSETAVIKQGLRYYNLIDSHQKQGYQIAWIKDGKIKEDPFKGMRGCPDIG